jgi:hypothetical protein
MSKTMHGLSPKALTSFEMWLSFYHNITKIWNNIDPKMKVASPPTIWKNEIYYSQNQTWTSVLVFLGKRKYSICKLHALRNFETIKQE